MGIFEAELQYWDQHDLNSFFTNFTRIPNGTHPINNEVDGGVAQTHDVAIAGGEAMLDLDMAYPIGQIRQISVEFLQVVLISFAVYPQTITVWNVDDIYYQTFPNDTYTWGFNTLLDANA